MNHSGTQTGGMSLHDARQQLADDGFALLVGMCEPGLLKRLLEVSTERSRTVTQALGTQTIGIGSAAGFHEIVQTVARPLGHSRFADRVRYRAPIPALVAAHRRHAWALMPNTPSVASCIQIRAAPPSSGISTRPT